jgi:hypothetical protein
MVNPGLPAIELPNLQPLTPEDIEARADRLMARSRRYVLGDPWLCPDCRCAARMMRGLLDKLTEAVGPTEAARLIAEISIGD